MRNSRTGPPQIRYSANANGAYHTARPPAQPPPTGGGMPPSYIHYPPQLRPQPQRQHQHQLPAARATIIPYYEGMNALCTPFYSSPLPVPIVYSSSTATSDTSRAQPQPGPYTWQTANPAQQPVTIMAQPPAVQPSPQPQPQPQSSPYNSNQFTYLQTRCHPSFTTTSGAVTGASTAGVQQAPPQVMVDNRQLQPPQPPIQGKNKNVRKNRIPIINPETMQEVNVDESGNASGGAGGNANVSQDHSNRDHHAHVQHSSNQVSGSTGNALLAANFAKQVALVALDNVPPSNRPPREEEPQVNGPAGVALGSSPVVEESVSVNKRPPGPTPVVSAQAEGTTYDLHRSSSSSRSVEIRSGESSPARSKGAPTGSAPPSSAHVAISPPLVPLIHQHVMAPPVGPVEPVEPAEPPKQQRRPHGPKIVDDKKPGVQPPPVLKPSPQVVATEEKEEESRSRTSSTTARTHPPQQPVAAAVVVVKEEEIPKQSIAPVNISKPSVVQPVPIKHPASAATLVETKSTPIVIEKSSVPAPSVATITEKPKPPPAVEKKQVDRPPVEKLTEKIIPSLVSVERMVVEKPTVVEQRPEPPKITKMTEKRPVSPAVIAPAPTLTPAPRNKTPFAEDLAMGAILKFSLKAAQTETQPPASLQQQQIDQQANSTDSSHGAVKTMQKKQKTKQKLREMNQKGVEKEGTELDAFFGNTRTPAVQSQAPASDNNNRTSGSDLANRNNDISNRTSMSHDSNKDIRNVDNILRPVDGTTRPDSNSKTDRDKSPAATTEDATNNNINNQIAQQYDEDDDADSDMVAAKNEENMKKNLVDSNITDSSQVIDPPPPAQASLKYQYKDDQWSPLNPQGKKVYDRDFLMKLREDPLSVKKPDITSDLEIYVKDRDNIGGGGVGVGMGGGGSMRRGMVSHSHYSGSGFGSSGGGMRGSNNGFMPDFSSRSLSNRMATKRNSQGSGGNRGPGGGGGGRSIKQLYNSLSLRDDYKLNQAENAWKPNKLNRTMDSKSKEEKESEDLYKKVRGILNKLTPQKFETLVQQFQSLPFTTLERLQSTIKLVFEKAVDEPAFSVSYAQLCKVLGRLQVLEIAQLAAAAAAGAGQGSQDQKGQVTFRKLLITRCQQEFETNKKLELDFEKRQQDINETPDPEKRKELQVQFNEEERKIRMRSVGLVTFIGELFKLKMLTVNIMFGCIKQLLGKIDEESLECLCKLLTTIGKEFEEQITNTSKGNDGIREFNDYFSQMSKLSRKHDGSKVSSRVRFMLQDVIELRQNNWVPRRDENKPKKMEEIQKEVERESEKAAILAAQSLRSMSSMNQDRGQRRNNPRGGNIQSEDGWTNVGSKYQRNVVTTEVTKMQGLRSTAGQELEGRGMRGDMTLGPSMSYSRWAAGSGSSNRTASGANFTDANTFSILDNADKKMQGGPPSSRMGSMKSQLSDDKERDKLEMLQNVQTFLRSDSNRDSRERDNSRGGPPGGSPSPSLSGPGPMARKPMQEPMKRPIDSSVKGDSSRESTPSAVPISQSADKLIREPAPVPVEPPVELNIDKLKQCASTVIEEYICNKNVQESVESYKEIFTDDGSIFVSTCLNYIVEQMKREKRLRTSQLLGELMKNQMFPVSVFVTEMGALFDIVYDLEVDIPHIWQYFGEIFGDIMSLEVLDFSNLKQASTAIPSEESGKKRLDATLRELMKLLLIEKGPVWIKKLWDSSNVQLKDFVNDKQASDAILAEFPFIEGKEVAVHDTNIPYDKIQEKLLHFLKGSTDNFDHIYAWLTTNVGNRTNEPSFIRGLTEAVIKASLELAGDPQKIDKELLHKNMMLIKRYVDNKEELELCCLYSVQHVVCATLMSPSGMLHDIFQELYDSLVISPDGFNKWRNDNTQCQGWRLEGRGVAIAVTKSFFTQMEEDLSNDEHDDDDMPS